MRILQVLVNSDSRHVRGGDAAYLVAALGEADSLLLSPATHELRAYNRLALGLSRGSFVIFVQDDTRPPPPSAGGLLDVRWLTRSVALFLRWPQVSSIDLATRPTQAPSHLPTNALPPPHDPPTISLGGLDLAQRWALLREQLQRGRGGRAGDG